LESKVVLLTLSKAALLFSNGPPITIYQSILTYLTKRIRIFVEILNQTLNVVT